MDRLLNTGRACATLALAFLFSPLALAAPPSNPSVSVADPTAGATTTYTISFDTGTNLDNTGLLADQFLILTAAGGPNFENAVLDSVAVSAGSLSGQIATQDVTSTGIEVTAGSVTTGTTVTFVLSDVVNPAVAGVGPDYTIRTADFVVIPPTIESTDFTGSTYTSSPIPAVSTPIPDATIIEEDGPAIVVADLNDNFLDGDGDPLTFTVDPGNDTSIATGAIVTSELTLTPTGSGTTTFTIRASDLPSGTGEGEVTDSFDVRVIGELGSATVTPQDLDSGATTTYDISFVPASTLVAGQLIILSADGGASGGPDYSGATVGSFSGGTLVTSVSGTPGAAFALEIDSGTAGTGDTISFSLNNVVNPGVGGLGPDYFLQIFELLPAAQTVDQKTVTGSNFVTVGLPTIQSAIADQTLAERDGATVVVADLDTVFLDGDGDPLTFSVDPGNDTSIATASVDGDELTVTPVGSGTTTISIRASDLPSGTGEGEVVDSFDVTVIGELDNVVITPTSLESGVATTYTVSFTPVSTIGPGQFLLISAAAAGGPDYTSATLDSLSGGSLAGQIFGTPGSTIAVEFTGGTAGTSDTVSLTFTGVINPLAGTGPDYNLALNNIVPFALVDQGTASGSTYDSGPPVTVTINQAGAQADPTAGATINFDVVFSEVVTGFETGDVTLSGTAGATTATVSGSGTSYSVAVTGMTTTGTVIASIAGGVAQDSGANPNQASTSSDNEVTYDITGPDVTIEQGAAQGDPSNSASLVFDVVFSEVVADFTTGDVTLAGTAGATTATVSGAGTDYTVTVTGMVTDGTVIASIDTAVATDSVGNANAASTSTDNTVTYDTSSPSVTIEQGAAQADPSNAASIVFDVVFSEPVQNFVTGDVTLTGTAGATTAAVAGADDAYTVTVSGMTGDGTVIVDLAADVAEDLAGNGNLASTSVDNQVTYDATAPTVTVEQGAAQADPSNVASVVFDVVFSEVVADFDSSDVVLEGTAGATNAAVTGTGTTYEVTVTGLAGDGTVIARLDAGAATDAAGNVSEASTSTDNEVQVETAPPDLLSFTRVTPAAAVTNADTLVLQAQFSEPVQNVDNSDFEVAGSTAIISDISSADQVTFAVTLSGGDLDDLNGTVGLNLAAGQDITDAVANPLAGGEPPTDETYTVDNTAPVLTAIERESPAEEMTAATTLTFRVSFDEVVANADAGDFETAGTSTATVTGFSEVLAGQTFDVTVSGGNLATFSGTVGLALAAGQDIADAAGNALPGDAPAINESYVLDNEPTDADLSITIDDGRSVIAPGGLADYVITVANAGPANVVDALVENALPIDLTGATWICNAELGASCAAAGTGDLAELVTLPAGSQVVFTVSATVAAPVGTPITNTATVTAPAGITEIDALNNSAADTTVVIEVIFANGFETAPAGLKSNRSGSPFQPLLLESDLGYRMHYRDGPQPSTRVSLRDRRGIWQVGRWVTSR